MTRVTPLYRRRYHPQEILYHEMIWGCKNLTIPYTRNTISLIDSKIQKMGDTKIHEFDDTIYYKKYKNLTIPKYIELTINYTLHFNIPYTNVMEGSHEMMIQKWVYILDWVYNVKAGSHGSKIQKWACSHGSIWKWQELIIHWVHRFDITNNTI